MEDERSAVRHEILSAAAAATESSALNRIPLAALSILYREGTLYTLVAQEDEKREDRGKGRGGEMVKLASLTYYVRRNGATTREFSSL